MDVTAIFESLKGTGLQQEEFHENMSWDSYLEEYQKLIDQDDKLKELMLIKKQEEAIEEVTLERILSTNFVDAKAAIDQMTIAKRIQMLDELSKYRDQLYDSFSRYGEPGVPREEQLSSADFRALLGRVKHLEIVQNWLYGII